MSSSRWLSRLVVVVALFAALLVVPTGVAMASGADPGDVASTEDAAGLIEELIDWLVGLVDGTEGGSDTGDGSGQMDPMG